MGETNKTIILLVMAEEKWHEANFLRKEIEDRGYRVWMLDMGLTGSPQGVCEISREEILQLSGRRIEEVALISDRGKRMPIVVEGAREKVKQLFSAGKLDGIICLGGTTGTQMGSAIMKSLPFGLPKLAVSSTASLPGFASRMIGTGDMTLMHSVVEIAGLNDFMRNVLTRAAGAICGMVEGSFKVPMVHLEKGRGKFIAMTHLGPCEFCATYIRNQLEQRGYQVIGFSASGIGDRAMEEIIEQQNLFDAVIDLAPGGVGEELFGFSRASGPSRLEAAGKKGIPQLIAPSVVNWGSPLKRNYKPDYDHRKKYVYDARRTFIRLSKDEMIKVADVMAEKLNKALGPVKFLIPLGGWSSLDQKGTQFYDEELDRAFVEELKKQLRKDIVLKEIDADLETPKFAQAMVEAFDEMMVS